MTKIEEYMCEARHPYFVCPAIDVCPQLVNLYMKSMVCMKEHGVGRPIIVTYMSLLFFFLFPFVFLSRLHWNFGYKGKVEREAENPYESSTSNDREKRE